MGNYEQYVIAPKREFRSLVPADWQEHLKHIEGIHIIGEQPSSVHVYATPEAIAQVRSMLGSMYHIEKSIPHYANRTV